MPTIVLFTHKATMTKMTIACTIDRNQTTNASKNDIVMAIKKNTLVASAPVFEAITSQNYGNSNQF